MSKAVIDWECASGSMKTVEFESEDQAKKVTEDDKTQEFRSYEDLKKDYETLRNGFKTEQDLLFELIDRYNVTENIDDKTTILQDLAYLLHQVDNAIVFSENNWLKLLVTDLETSSSLLKPLLIDCLSAAMQGYALSSMSTLLRDFPTAQWKYFNQTKSPEHVPIAHQILLTMLKLPSSIKDSHKLRLKSISLINDLLREREELLLHTIDPDQDLERIRQYNLVNFDASIAEFGWCPIIIKYLLELEMEHILQHQDSDFLGQWLVASARILRHCPKSERRLLGAAPELESKLISFSSHFEELHSDDWDCKEILDAINQLSKTNRAKDEL
ncbi:nucleotide exchange factor sil1 [Cichlidogyrus casuarinus]|uniref:Nucleotide exchange factor sil1 n=1 Tax=Cichlidogyrus casuarinus TaxID=1844966 RepID=A0ABD2QHR9_9PLAT